jgi:DNA repair protein RadD
MKKTLRPYQQDVLNKLLSRLKVNSDPVIVNASVGAGKSLIIAELLLIVERAGWRALCLTMNSELIRQNTQTYIEQGGNAGIFCAQLGRKDSLQPVIFASPHSVVRSIKNKGKLSNQPMSLIIIDECHNVSYNNKYSMYMRIYNHYAMFAQTERHKFRCVGLTGTPYRGKSISIVGEDLFFKEQVCDISTAWLIENNYLVPPIFGKHDHEIDFSKLRIKSNGQFDQKQLSTIVDKNDRLTAEIMREVVLTVESEQRNGAFIFASTKRHCQECIKSLPSGQAAIITGDITGDTRNQILDDARNGKLKYLVNINVLTVGVDIPLFDTVVFVRPTESLVLYTQAIGRGLRLHDDKQDCLILDYAGNLDRNGDIDNPIINEAVKQKEKDDPDYCIPCMDCNTMNKETARRCIGIINDKRCDHYFEFKECPECQTYNDIVSRQCRHCNCELIDPNSKLNNVAQSNQRYQFDIERAKYWVLENAYDQTPVFYSKYITLDGFEIFEQYITRTQKSCNIFWGKFVKVQIKDYQKYYPHLNSLRHIKHMIQSGEILTPHRVECIKKGERYFITKKYIQESL